MERIRRGEDVCGAFSIHHTSRRLSSSPAACFRLAFSSLVTRFHLSAGITIKICQEAGKKNNQGAERDRLFGLSGEEPKAEREEGVVERSGGDTDKPPRTLWVAGSRDDERGRGSAPGPCCQGSPQDGTERKCHSRRACWANLDSAESCCSSLHNKSNTITPTPPRTRPHTQPGLRHCLEECVRKHRQHAVSEHLLLSALRVFGQMWMDI
ncbi:hypothetical protein PAMP_005535 [Pampus punctatissimus]